MHFFLFMSVFIKNVDKVRLIFFCRLGLATAPVLFAADEHEELDSLIKRRFSRNGDVQRAFHLVLASNGLEQTQFLAKSYGKAAYQSIKSWKNSEAKQELLTILDEAIQRTK